MYTLHATKGPFSEAQNLSLTFDYQVSPVDTVEVTFVEVNTNLQVMIEFNKVVWSTNRDSWIFIFFVEPMRGNYAGY